MGDPKKPRKKYTSPKMRWQKERFEKELALVGKYGLRNKKEVWHLQTMLSKFRARARKLLSLEEEEEKEVGMKELNSRLSKLGLISESAKIDDILSLSIQDILERRLQTIVLNKGLAKTIHQARQFITHGHIAINGRKITSPGHLVLKSEEISINYSPKSALSSPEHPIRSK